MNKKARRTLYALGAVMVLFLLQQAGAVSALLTTLADVPWWIYFVLAGIIFSGYKFTSSAVEENRNDQEWIEEQGNVYIRRMEAEKKRRHRH